MDIVGLIAERCSYIHARVGYPNGNSKLLAHLILELGPQVNDPRDPDNEVWNKAHEKCWDLIWKTQREKGAKETYLCPEFGPASYMQVQPYTQEPVSNLWDVCEWQANRQRERFAKQ